MDKHSAMKPKRHRIKSMRKSRSRKVHKSCKHGLKKSGLCAKKRGRKSHREIILNHVKKSRKRRSPSK